jgi:hypothetical protein
MLALFDHSSRARPALARRWHLPCIQQRHIRGHRMAITPGQLRRGAATSGEVVRLYNLYDLLAPLHRQTLAAADTAAALHLIDELDHQVLPVRS